MDQFEEVFTLCQDGEERDRFVAALLDAAHEPGGRTRVVVGLRADFYAHCAGHPRLVAALQDAQVLVGPMTTDELVEAITQPAAQAGLMVEKALVTTVVHDAAERPGALPFVSHALWETWRRRHGKGLFLTDYLATGGVHGAVAQSADRVYDDLDERRQRVARVILLRLTALGEGTEDTRRRVPRAELLDSPDRDAVAEVLSRLAAARLVTVDADTVEVAHEALLRSWPRLRSWLSEDRETLLAHRRLTEDAADWEGHERDEGLLYRGARLEMWRDRPLEALNDAEHAFLAAGRRAAEREQRQRRRRVRLTIGGLGVATAMVTVLAVVALSMATRADHERAAAVARQLVTDARNQLELDPELGLLLAREAYRRMPNEEAESVLRQAVVDSHVRATLSGHEGEATGVAVSPNGRQLATTDARGTLRVWDWADGRVQENEPRMSTGLASWSPVFSPDGRRVATVGANGMVAVQDWADGSDLVLLGGYPNSVWRVAFSPDGRWLAGAGYEGRVALWPAAGGADPIVLSGHGDRVQAVSFSPNGRLLASGGNDGTVRIWDLVGGGARIVSQGQAGAISAVAFSPDGRHVATTGADGTVRVWDATGTSDAVLLGHHGSGATSVAYSPDGHWIASAGHDRTVRVWNAAHPANPVVLRGHRDTVSSVTFSEDGKSVLSASADGTVKVWAVDELADMTVLRGGRGPVNGVAASADGRHLASFGQDNTVLLWDITSDRDPLVLGDHQLPVVHVVFSPDGRHLASVDAGGLVLVRATRNPANTVRLPPTEWPLSEPRMTRVSFSPDGERFAATSNTGGLWLWRRTGTGDPAPLPGSQGVLATVVWSPVGPHVAAGPTPDGAVLLWDVRTRASPTVLPGHPGQVHSLVFSPDGTRLASGGNDGTVHLWRVADPARPVVLPGHQGGIRGATFSLDGRDLITSSDDATVRIWRTSGTAAPLVLDGFRSSAQAVVALTDGRYATTHDDGTIQIWRYDASGPVEEVLAQSQGHVTRELTRAEREMFGLA